MNSSDLNFYINKHRKAYEERLKKELESQENKNKEGPKAINKSEEKENLVKEDNLSQVESDYIYALKLNESLNGNILNNNTQEKNNFNSIIDTKNNYKDLNENYNEENDDNVRKPDNTYVECLLEDNVLNSYCVDYNFRNIRNKSNSFNDNNHFNEQNNIVISSDDDKSVDILKNPDSFKNKNSCIKNDAISYKEEKGDVFCVNNENLVSYKKKKKINNQDSNKDNEINIINKNKENFLKKNFPFNSNNNNELLFSDKKKLKNEKISNGTKNYRIESSHSIQSIHLEKENSINVENMDKYDTENSKIQNYDDLITYNSRIKGYESLSNTPIWKPEEVSYIYPEDVNYLYDDEKYKSMKNNVRNEKINIINCNYEKSKKKTNNKDGDTNKNIKINNIKNEEIKSRYKNEISIKNNNNNMHSEFINSEKDLFHDFKEKSDKRNKNIEKTYKMKKLENKNSKKYEEILSNDYEYNYKECKNKRANNIIEEKNNRQYEDNNRHHLKLSKKCLLNEEITEICDNKNIYLKNNSKFLYMNKNNDNEEKNLNKFYYYDKYENSVNRNTPDIISNITDTKKNKTNNILKSNTINNLNNHIINNALINLDNNSRVIVDKDYRNRVNTENKNNNSLKKNNLNNFIFNHSKENYKNAQINENMKNVHPNDSIKNGKNETTKFSVDNIKCINFNKNKEEVLEKNSSYNKTQNYNFEDNKTYKNNEFVSFSNIDTFNNKNINSSHFNDKKDKTIVKNESPCINNSYEFKISKNIKNISSDKGVHINNYNNTNINTIFIDDNDNNNIFINNKNRNTKYNLVRNTNDGLFSSTYNKVNHITNDICNNNTLQNKNYLDTKSDFSYNNIYISSLNSKDQSRMDKNYCNENQSNKYKNDILINRKEYEQENNLNDLNKNRFYNYINNELDNEKSIQKDFLNNNCYNNYRNIISIHNSDTSDNNNMSKKENDKKKFIGYKENKDVLKNDNYEIYGNNKGEDNMNHSSNNNMLSKNNYIHNENNIRKDIEGSNNIVYIKDDYIYETNISDRENGNFKNENFDKKHNHYININRTNTHDYVKNNTKHSLNDINLSLSSEYFVDDDNITSKNLVNKLNVHSNNDNIKNIPKNEKNSFDITTNDISKEYVKYSRNYSTHEHNYDNNIEHNFNQNIDNNVLSSYYNEESTNDEDVFIQQAIINSLTDL
ncbi:conserved Plasmodium protein, unknown function [Plasmodium gallinaceum]|uniref:Uncharacterized protein n=1 Tax=Plasmodium gallinaceum TaxID=5849 RepID=A0A1J1GWE0_PLAGA|nr:conserved Plasmodium protein, unknown function [Plasmodium gallinaceum]CRG96791.1 conserved Plasmodium protein, unknown function [Plasmodium gallinaceum]